MLSSASVKSASGAANYFAKDDYYTGEHSAEASEWGGLHAEDAGLTGEVSKESFEKILNGEMPDGEKVGQVQNRQAGMDMTFSMPKSASVLAYVAGDQRILAAHMTAVKATMGWVEKSFAEGRTYERTKAGEPVRTGNLTYALFQHDTSRALDPQGHIHVVIANMTKMANGVWQALHNRALWKNNATIGAAYHAQFRIELARIGYETSVTGKHGQFEIKGVPDKVLRAFSQRRETILAKVAELDIKHPKGVDRVSTNTRDPKLNVKDKGALRGEWQARAAALGFDGRALVAAAIGRSGSTIADAKPATLERIRETLGGLAQSLGDVFKPRDPLVANGIDRLRISPDELRSQHAVASAVRILAQREAAFAVSDVAKTALELGLKGVSAPMVDKRISELIRAERLIPGKTERIDNVVTHVTTPEAIATEMTILGEIERGKGASTPIVSADAAIERLNAVSGNKALNAGQLAAATLLVASTDRIVAVQGVSGAGKSTMLASVARVAEAEGRGVLGLAIMKRTASDLGKDTGIEAKTLSAFINSYIRQAHAGEGPGFEAARAELTGTVLMLDEASMVGSEQMNDLVTIANTLGVERLALVGDRQQITAVDHGKAFAMAQAGGIRMARMDENQRQRTDQLRTVAALTNRGEVRQAMAVLGSKVIANPRHVEAAAAHWLGLSQEERAKTSVFSSGRVARAELNERIQDGLRGQGALSGEGVAYPVLDKVNMTREELRYAHSYKVGQGIDLAFALRSIGLPAGTFEIVGIDANGRVEVMVGGKVRSFDPQKIDPMDKTDAMQLVTRETIRLHENDRIRWTKNDKERGLENAGTARVLSAEPGRLMLEAADGRIHELKSGDPMLERMSLAYALNMHAAQGMTSDNAIAVMSSKESNLSNQRLFNVTVTRVRDDIRLFTDDREKLTAAILRNEGGKTSALETTGALPIDPGRDAGQTRPGRTGGAEPVFNPVPPAHSARDPSLDLTRLRIEVEPRGPEIPFPEKDLGLEL